MQPSVTKYFLVVTFVSLMVLQISSAAASAAITPLPLTWTVDNEKSNLQYKRLNLTNTSEQTVRIFNFKADDAEKGPFFTCNLNDIGAFRAQCPSFVRAHTLQSCFAASGHGIIRLEKNESCHVWVKTLDTTSNEQLGSSEKEIRFTAEIMNPDHTRSPISMKAKLTRHVKLYIGGNFDKAGGESLTEKLASFDGIKFDSVGNSLPPSAAGQINTLAMFEGNLYIAGKFHVVDSEHKINANNIAYWNGKQWHNLPNNPPHQNSNGIHEPVNVLKTWQIDPHNKDSERLFVGFDWGNLTAGGTIDTRMLATWHHDRWHGIAHARFKESGKLCSQAHDGGRKWRISSLAILGEKMIAGGPVCIDSTTAQPNESFGLRFLHPTLIWSYITRWNERNTADRKNILGGFVNSPTRRTPEIHALYAINVHNHTRLLVGGNSAVWQNGASFGYSSPDSKTLTEVQEDWSKPANHSIRAFADGPKAGTFYMVGRRLANDAYVAEGKIPHAVNAWKTIGGWTYDPRHPNDIVLSIIKMGDKLYIGGRFDRAGSTANSSIVNNIAMLEGNTFEPLRGKEGHVGVKGWPTSAITVNAMLAAPSLTVSDLKIE
jgi:hypothetical protein